MRSTTHRILLTCAVAAAGAVGAGTAAAGPPTPGAPVEDEIPAGIACADFDLRIEGTGGLRVDRTFVDRDGEVVRTLSTGTGSALTFTNLSTGASVSFSSTGAVQRTQISPDGTTTVTTTGSSVLILFPTDVPAGPSTTLYVGRVVFTVDAAGVFTLVSTSGRSTDICAASTA